MPTLDDVRCTSHEPSVPIVVVDIDDDASRVYCPECQKEFGTWGDVKAAVFKEAASQAKGQYDKTLDNIAKMPGWKVTKG